MPAEKKQMIIDNDKKCTQTGLLSWSEKNNKAWTIMAICLKEKNRTIVLRLTVLFVAKFKDYLHKYKTDQSNIYYQEFSRVNDSKWYYSKTASFEEPNFTLSLLLVPWSFYPRFRNLQSKIKKRNLPQIARETCTSVRDD